MPPDIWIRLEDVPDHGRKLGGRLPGALPGCLLVPQIAPLGGVQPSVESRLGDQEVLLHPASGDPVVGHVPQDLQPLHRGVALPTRGVTKPRLEQPVLGLQAAVLISEPGQFPRRLTCSDGPLQAQ